MGNAIYPRLPGLKWPVQRTPVWKTTVKTSANGREWRHAPMTSPRYRYGLQYEFLRSDAAFAEYQQLFDFFNSRSGSYDSFLFVDQDDCVVDQQLLAIGTATATQYQLARSLPDAPHNLVPYSQDFTQWNNVGTTTAITPNADTSPDGTATATLVLTPGASSQGLMQYVNVIPGQQYTLSFYAKRSAASAAEYRIFDQTSTVNIAGGSYYSQINASTYTRVSVIFTAPAGCRIVRVYPIADFSGGAAPLGCYLWGVQVNRGGLDPYVASGTSAVMPALEPVYDLASPPLVNVWDWQGFTRLYATPRTNLCLNSLTPGGTGWNLNGSATLNNTTSADPSGSSVASQITSDTSGNSGTYKNVSGLTIGATYTYSMMLRNVSSATNIKLGSDTGGDFKGYFNLVNGTVNSVGGLAISASITLLGSGWYLASVTFVATATSMAIVCYNHAATPATWQLYGAQCEAGPAATRRINTTGAAVSVTDYTVSGTAMLTLASQLGVGAMLYWSGSYYWRMRFDSDELPFDQFMRRFWQTGQVKLLTVKP